MSHFITDFRNKFDFFLRNMITFSRKNYVEKGVNIEKVFICDEQKKLYSLLKEKYDLSPLFKYNDINFLTNLYFLDIFDKYISYEKKNISVLDIGSKNWNYSGSEYIFFGKNADELCLNGIELDAYRLCTNLYNRYEISKFYTKDFKNTNYIAGDFMSHEKQYDYIIWILPFITEYPHMRWGLPLKYFKPEKMIKHAFKLLNEGGELLIINQGENEYNIQKELYARLNIDYNDIGEVNNVFNQFRNKRFCTVVKKYHL